MSSKADWHYLEWDEAKVARFHDWAAKWEAWQDEYFSKQVGVGIINFLRYVVPLQGRILDYGCGPGYLVEHLLAAGIRCEGVDFSPESVNVVNARFAANPLWDGAKLFTGEQLPFPDDAFDLIICLETIEHVLPVHLGSLLNDLRRILKPQSGRLFVTTPNSENLARNQVYCPECSSVFHRVQHVASFTPTSLEALLTVYGFITIFCNVTDFGRFQQPWLPSPLDWSPRRFARLLMWIWVSVLGVVGLPRAPFGGCRFQQLIGHGPHLFWLGAKE